MRWILFALLATALVSAGCTTESSGGRGGGLCIGDCDGPDDHREEAGAWSAAMVKVMWTAALIAGLVGLGFVLFVTGIIGAATGGDRGGGQQQQQQVVVVQAGEGVDVAETLRANQK